LRDEAGRPELAFIDIVVRRHLAPANIGFSWRLIQVG